LKTSSPSWRQLRTMGGFDQCHLQKLAYQGGLQDAKSQSKIDGFVKSPKRTNFLISHLIISIGYEIEILEFWLFTRLSRLQIPVRFNLKSCVNCEINLLFFVVFNSQFTLTLNSVKEITCWY
jgi:hypothetical protein